MIIVTEKYYKKKFKYAGILTGDKTIKRKIYWFLFVPLLVINQVVEQNGMEK